MEESGGGGGSQSQLTQPPPVVDVDDDEAALPLSLSLSLSLTKRARKRSRYLSPPYTDTDVQGKKAAGGSHKKREEEEEEEERPPHVTAAEALSALRATALGHGEGMDAAALRFLATYSRNRERNSDDHPDSHAAAGGGDKPPSVVSAAGVGRKMLNLNLNAGLDDGTSSAKKIRKNPKKNPHPPAAAAGANAKQQKDGDGTMENAAVSQHAIAATHGFAATATHGHPNPPPVVTATPPINIRNEKKRRRKMNKNRTTMKTAGQHSYVGNPVALVLDFVEGPPLPSREDLLSTFSKFGFVIDSETTISQDKHTAHVAFATRAQAETALSCAATLGTFGPPFAVASLQDLPPITLNTPLPKLPLTDIRNNLGKMILSLSSKAKAAPANSPQEADAKTGVDSLSLVGEMQHLLAKVDEVLQVQGASATAHHA